MMKITEKEKAELLVSIKKISFYAQVIKKDLGVVSQYGKVPNAIVRIQSILDDMEDILDNDYRE